MDMAKHFVNIDVNYIGTHNKVTFADIDFQIVDDNMNQLYYRQSRAVAQRNYEDKNSELIGVKLALGRALEQLGKSLQKNAWGEVTHQENVKKSRESVKEPSAKKTAVNQSRKKV
jgi:hypothetical protein